MDMRCEHKLLAIIVTPAPGGEIELKCSSRFCGAGAGVVVLHRFSTENGDLIGTSRFRDTPMLERNANGRSNRYGPAVRYP